MMLFYVWTILTLTSAEGATVPPPHYSTLKAPNVTDNRTVQLECSFYLSSSYIHVGSGRFDDVRRTLDSDLNTRVVLPSSKDQWLRYLLNGRSQLDKVLVYLPEKSAIADIWDSDHNITLQEKINNIQVFSREMVLQSSLKTVFSDQWGSNDDVTLTTPNRFWGWLQTQEPAFQGPMRRNKIEFEPILEQLETSKPLKLHVEPLNVEADLAETFAYPLFVDEDPYESMVDPLPLPQSQTEEGPIFAPMVDPLPQSQTEEGPIFAPMEFGSEQNQEKPSEASPWPSLAASFSSQQNNFGGHWVTTHNVTWTEVRTVCNLTLARNFSLHGDNLIFENSLSPSPTNSGEEPEYTDTNTAGSYQDTGSGMRGAVLEFDCGGVETESVFVRSTDTGEDMEILETEFLGRPISETPSELVQVGKIQREGATVVPHIYSRHDHKIGIQEDLGAYIFTYRENLQYLPTEDLEYFKKSFTIDFYLNDYMDNSFIIVYPGEGIVMSSCRVPPPETMWPLNKKSVCDGTKTEHQYNTWGFHITHTGIRVLCDGVEMISLPWLSCFGSSQGISPFYNLVQVDELTEGFIGFTVHYLEDINENTHEEFFIDFECMIFEDKISRSCPEKYDLFDRDTGRVKEEAQFLYDQILHEFNSSLAREALMIGITREKRMSAEAAWMRDKYPVLLEETWENWREQEEWLEYAEEEKLAILKDTQRELKFWELEELKRAFASAVKFYEEMDELLKETIGTVANSTTLIGLMEPIQEAMNMILDGLTEDKAEDYTTSAPPLFYHYISYQIIPSASSSSSSSSSSSPVEDEEFDIIRLSVEDEPPQDGELDIGRENDQNREIPISSHSEIFFFINSYQDFQEDGFSFLEVIEEHDMNQVLDPPNDIEIIVW